METFPEGEAALQQDQDRLVGFFHLAFREMAAVLGGEDLVAEVEGLPTDIKSGWPANALRYLEARHPGAAETAFSRALAIQVEVHADETAKAAHS